jgi:anti-sigma factor RsiW
MNCIDLDPLIYPYLDGELDEGERGHLEAHAAGCAGCRGRLSREAAFQGALRRSVQLRTRAPAPEALREMLRAGIRKENRRVQMLSWARWGSAALMAATASVIYLELRPGHREQISEDATLRYQRRLPFELTQASRADVERWFGDKMSLRVPLPHLPGATIAGARLSNLREHDAAYVVYQLPASEQRDGEDHRLGLFVLADDAREIPSVTPWPEVGVHSVRGFTVASWRSGGLVYELVSDMDEAALRRTLRDLDPTAAPPSPPPEPTPVRQRPMLPIPPRNPALELIPAGFQN